MRRNGRAYECFRSGLGEAAASSRWTATEKRFQKSGSWMTTMMLWRRRQGSPASAAQEGVEGVMASTGGCFAVGICGGDFQLKAPGGFFGGVRVQSDLKKQTGEGERLANLQFAILRVKTGRN